MSIVLKRYSYTVTLIGVVLLFLAAIWTYRELVWSVFGSLESEGAPVVRAFDEGGRVALLTNQYSRDANAAHGDEGLSDEWFEATLETWRAFLKSAGADVEELSDADIENGRLHGFDMLVLPSARALSELQIEQIKKYLYSGGGVFATGTPGLYHPDGEWRGWEFIQEAFGIEPAGFLNRGYSNFQVYADTFPGRAQPGLYLPIDHSVDSGGSDFAPLSGYRYSAALDAPRPAANFAVADTLTRMRDIDGRPISEAATTVQFYSWLGGDPAAATEAAFADGAFGRVTFLSGSPLAAGLPAAFRMKTGTFDLPLQLQIVEPRTKAAAFWFDFAAGDQLARDELPGSTAVAYGHYGAGRFVHFGHELSAMGYDPLEQSVLARFFQNTLHWLGHSPLVWVRPWPAPYDRAAFVGTIAYEDPLPLETMMGPFREADIIPTVFMTSNVAAGYPELFGRLSERTEIGMIAGPNVSSAELHTLRQHFPILPQGIHLQDRTLSQISADTIREVGFGYVVPDTLGRAQQAEMVGGDGLVSIPRTSRTDHDLLARTPAASHSMRMMLMEDDLDRAVAEGGLYTLLVHPDGFGHVDHLPLLRETLQSLRSRNFWLPTASELADWTRAHAGISVRAEARGPRRLNIRITNNSEVSAQNVAVVVALGNAVVDFAVRSELVGAPSPELTLDDDGTALTIVVDDLAPGQYRIYQVDLTLESL